MTDILIRHVTAITLDSRRRVLDDASTELALALERSGLGHLATETDELWRVNRRGAGGRAADQ